ncbi:tyrosine-type recombinase/integrase [Desulfopila inferna]|uniref:tyrosine-type recombinase/integrase n=1 Tax=Desulfopila inferna TaxID=468528 RepID=UPI0019629DE0|nr:site-specific integrase [Desulfopila inferna]MBM9604213.1 site-specific integrase [Desulfopila inferna]
MAKKSKNHHLELRGDTWYFVAMVNGKRIRRALSTSVTEARRTRDQYLKEIDLYGKIQSSKAVYDPDGDNEEILFGEAAQKWANSIVRKVKPSTLRDYKSAMNTYILPRFGNTPISEITFLEIEEFMAQLTCSAKRINNVLVPMRAVMHFAQRAEMIDKNPMNLIANLKTDKPDISPLSMDEVNLFLNAVHQYYTDFFTVAFFTGMRFGEMAALKWENVSFKLGVIKVKETRVRGEEGRPKTNGSVRDIKMMPPVIEALTNLKARKKNNSPYVFVNKSNNPLLPNSINYHVWKPGLRKAGLKPRSLYQTRHTFATLMLDSGELPGWVQKMMGHESLKMILEKYYSYIKNYQRNDGEAFMENVFVPGTPSDVVESVN